MLIKDSLENLTQDIALMARRAQEIYMRSLEVLDTRSEEDVREVRDMDRVIDDLEVKIDNRCMSLLLKDPYAADFRYIFSASKAIRDLERVGDNAKTISKWSVKMPGDIPDDLRLLGRKAREALDLSLEALLEGDADKAGRVIQLEFQVDEIEDRIVESAESIAEAFIAKAMERIGDLATNIAEDVIFYVKARDIRHGGYEQESAER